MEGTLAPITLLVDAATGNDDPTTTRPARVLFGSHVDEPYETLQAAIDAVPRILRHEVTIRCVGALGEGQVVGFGGTKLTITTLTSSSFDSLEISGNTAIIELNGIDPGELSGAVNKCISLVGIELSVASSLDNIDQLVADGTWAEALTLTGGGTAMLSGSVGGLGRFIVLAYRYLEVHLTASACSGSVVRALHCGYVGHELTANTCTATPLEMINCGYTEPINTGLDGTNPGAAFGVSCSGGGYHVFTGADLTGAQDLDLDSRAISWSDLGNFNYIRGGTWAFWSDNKWKILGQFTFVNDSGDDFDDVQVRDLQFTRFFKQYGANRPLPTSDVGSGDYSTGAYTEIVAHAGGGQASATIVGLQLTKVKTVATTNDSVRFFNDSEAPGTGFGTRGQVWNAGVNNLRIYPPSGKQIIFNGSNLGTDAAATLTPGNKVDWFTDSLGNWYLST